MKTIRIWTSDYNPFILGGDVHAPAMCEIEVKGSLVPLGKGMKGYLITAPDGSTVVAESTTGALIGPTLEEVREDIKATSLRIVKEQMKDAKYRADKAVMTSPEKFWAKMKRSK